jgi:hypothetical protein
VEKGLFVRKLCRMSLSLIETIAEKMCEPKQVKALVMAQSIHSIPNWSDLSLFGYPALLLLFSTLSPLSKRLDWEKAEHTCVLQIKEAIEQQGIFDLSLFSGAAGLCYAVRQASHGGMRYQKMLHSLESFLLARVDERYLFPLLDNIKNRRSSPVSLYDPILGITGIGRYALESPFLSELVPKICSALVELSHPIRLEKDLTIPGWYVSCEHQFHQQDRASYPQGNFNLGLAHGIPSVLAFLSLALLRGIEVPGQKEALIRIVSWIRTKSYPYRNATYWPARVSWEEEVLQAPVCPTLVLDGWCYGVPGIARSLFLAGRALGDQELRRFAEKSFLEVFTRTPEEWGLASPTVCHGLAGLLAITRAMVHDGVNAAPQAENLTNRLLAFYQPEAPFGFKDHDPVEMDKIGVLDGAVGVALSLLAPDGGLLPLLI